MSRFRVSITPKDVTAFGLGIAAHDIFIHSTEDPAGSPWFPTDRLHGWMAGVGLAILGLAMEGDDEEE